MSDPGAIAGPFPEEKEEHKLIEAIGAGDSLAFEALIKRYQDQVMNFIYKYLGDRFGAEDLAQEVFLNVYQAAPKFEPRCKVSTWIFTIAYNLSVNEIRRRRRFCLAADTAGYDKGTEQAAPDFVEISEVHEELMDLVQRLPEKQRAALILRVNDELSYSEISNVLSTSIPGVESLLFRARENLRKMLGKNRQE